MFTSSDYLEMAKECVASARAAKTDAERKHYLDMAKMWATAAAELDGSKTMLAEFANEAG